MPIPVEDSLCRFIRPGDWSYEKDRPKAKAFKQENMSVWHEGRLTECGVTLEELQLESLEDSGRAFHTVADYLELADEVEQKTGKSCELRIEWRSEDCNVLEHWRQWRYAHVQVEMMDGSRFLPPSLRNLLALKARRLDAPTKP